MQKFSNDPQSLHTRVPSVDKLFDGSQVAPLAETYGRHLTMEAVRTLIKEVRAALQDEGESALNAFLKLPWLLFWRPDCLNKRRHLSRVFNLTGTVLHTDLGEAPLPQEAIDAMVNVAGGASNLEYDLEDGKRETGTAI